MKLVLKALEVLWPSVVLAGIWLVVALMALWYARSTRRPIFLFGGLGALLLLLGEIISPVRVAVHYLKGTPIPGGTAGKVEVLVGAYKYQIAIEAVGALFFLVGILLEVRRARRRARVNAAMAAGAGSPAAAPVGAYAQEYAAPQPRTLPTMQAPQGEWPCPRCQTLLSPDAQFCGNCGMQLTPAGPLPLSAEPPSAQGRTSARASGSRSNEDFL